MATTYTTISGDTWDIIAKKVYDDESKTDILMSSNRKLLDIFIFSSGTTILVPEILEEDIASVSDWRF